MKKLNENILPKATFNLDIYRRYKDILDRHADVFQNPHIKGYGIGFTEGDSGVYFLVDVDHEDISQLNIGDKLEGIPVYWRDYRELLRATKPTK